MADLLVNGISNVPWEVASEKLAALMVVPASATWSLAPSTFHRSATVANRDWPWGLPWIGPATEIQWSAP